MSKAAAIEAPQKRSEMSPNLDSANRYYESIDNAEEVHEEDAYAAVFLNVTLIGCVLLAYYIKKNRIYFIPER